MNFFQPGHLCGAAWSPVGQGFVANLCINSASIDIQKLLFDVTNTCNSNGGTARLAGRWDVSGTCAAKFDADVPPYLNPPLVREGVSGFFLYYPSNVALNRPFQLPMIIEKVHWEFAVDTESRYSFDLKMNSFLGFLVYPSA